MPTRDDDNVETTSYEEYEPELASGTASIDFNFEQDTPGTPGRSLRASSSERGRSRSHSRVRHGGPSLSRLRYVTPSSVLSLHQ